MTGSGAGQRPGPPEPRPGAGAPPAAALDGAGLRPIALEAVELELVRRSGPLLAQIQAALGARGRPLRWAITAVEPGGGGGPEGARLRIEAVLQR